MTTDPESVNWPPGWQRTRDTHTSHPPPTPGRIVLLTGNDGRTWPAIVVTAAPDTPTTVSLTAFSPMPTYFPAVPYDPAGTPTTWRWPERV